MNDERTDGVSFAVQTVSKQRPFAENRGGPNVCSNCGRVGHIAENCFRLIGYPPWYEDKLSNSSGNNYYRGGGRGGAGRGGVGRGFNTTAVGSMKGKPHDTPQVNHIFSNNGGSSSVFGLNAVKSHATNSPLTPADRVGISRLSDAQWKTLVHMLEERKSTSNEHLSGKYFLESWIIDTGASNHMTGSFEFLLDVCDMAPVLIKLPDGRFTTSTKQGRVKLSIGSEVSINPMIFAWGSLLNLFFKVWRPSALLIMFANAFPLCPGKKPVVD